MSRAYREFCERYPAIAMMYEDSEARAIKDQMRLERNEWLADQAAQAEFQSWLDTLRHERN